MGIIIDNKMMSIDEIKTSLVGYHKGAVLEYVQCLLKLVEEEKQMEVKRYAKEVMCLERENEYLKSQFIRFKESRDDYGKSNGICES